MTPRVILSVLLALVLACFLGLAWAAGAWEFPDLQFPCPPRQDEVLP